MGSPKIKVLNIITQIIINDIKHIKIPNKDEIENSAGMTFDWRELPEKKASRIIIARQNDFLDQSKWNEQFDWIMESLIKMKKTFKKFI